MKQLIPMHALIVLKDLAYASLNTSVASSGALIETLSPVVGNAAALKEGALAFYGVNDRKLIDLAVSGLTPKDFYITTRTSRDFHAYKVPIAGAKITMLPYKAPTKGVFTYTNILGIVPVTGQVAQVGVRITNFLNLAEPPIDTTVSVGTTAATATTKVNLIDNLITAINNHPVLKLHVLATTNNTNLVVSAIQFGYDLLVYSPNNGKIYNSGTAYNTNVLASGALAHTTKATLGSGYPYNLTTTWKESMAKEGGNTHFDKPGWMGGATDPIDYTKGYACINIEFAEERISNSPNGIPPVTGVITLAVPLTVSASWVFSTGYPTNLAVDNGAEDTDATLLTTLALLFPGQNFPIEQTALIAS